MNLNHLRSYRTKLEQIYHFDCSNTVIKDKALLEIKAELLVSGVSVDDARRATDALIAFWEKKQDRKEKS